MNIEQLYGIYPILLTLEEKHREQLEERGVFRSLYSGEYIKAEEESCPGLFFILSGEIQVYRLNEQGEQTVLYRLRKGDICHESLGCSLNYRSLNLMAQGMQDSQLFLVPVDVVEKHLLNDVGFLQYIYANLYNNFRLIVDHKESMIHQSLEERLMELLAGRGSKTIYTTHQEIAAELGSAREVVSRKLKELERRGVLALSRGKIQLLNG